MSYTPLTQERLAELMANRPKPANAISLEDLKARVKFADFTVVTDSNGDVRKTLCDLELDNGFHVSGESVVIDPANFNEELGQHFAYMDALNKLWVPMAFAKREMAYQAALANCQ